PDRLTRTDPRYGTERFLALKLQALLDGPLAARPSVVIWGAGPIGKRWSRELRARGVAVSAFVEVDRRKIAESIHGAPVVGAADPGRSRAGVHWGAGGQPGARGGVGTEARGRGLGEPIDFVAVA